MFFAVCEGTDCTEDCFLPSTRGGVDNERNYQCSISSCLATRRSLLIIRGEIVQIKRVVLSLSLLVALTMLNAEGGSDVGDFGLPYSFDDVSSSIEPVVAESNLPEDWHEKAVFYELFVREFYDSDGDGVGDFNGVTAKLDYLKSLGIGGIWLLPINANYDDDHGYAVTDYMDLESDYGTIEDFKRLVAEAHKRGIGIVMDLVLNHSSHFHPYFLDAVKSKDSPYRDWYIWSEKDPYWRQPWGTKGVWHETQALDYYFGLFDRSMPDLNYRNKEVYNYLKDVLVYWLNLGVDGFRFDAATHIFENDAGDMKDLPETIAFFEGVRNVVDQYPNKFLIGEVDKAEYLGDGTNRLHAYFNFGFIAAFTRSVYYKDSSIFMNQLQDDYDGLNAGSTFGVPLGNHDFFLGPRVATRFKGSMELARIAATVQMLLPGIPFVYYGEEIGMGSRNRYQYDWALRTPMQWDSSEHSGFSTSEKIVPRKVNREYKKINVALQEGDEQSLLNFYRSIIALRNDNATLQTGSVEFVNISSDVVAFTRTLEGEEPIHVVVNIGKRKVALDKGVVVMDEVIYNSALSVEERLLPYQALVFRGTLKGAK